MPQPQAQPPRRKGPNVGLIIGIIVLLLVLVVGGGLAFRAFGHSSGQTNTNTNTPTTGTTATTGVTNTPSTNNQTPGPSGSPIDTGAAAIITNVQTASAIDSNYMPTNLTTQFKVGDVVYVTYHLNLTQSGYVQAKVYLNGSYGTQTSIAVTVGKDDHGYFNYTYNEAGTGAFELYWCTQSDCSDAKLAAVATFTVS
jgi:cytoskeletal protein RodZ